MKKNLFIAVLFLLPLCGFSQTTKPIEGFLGIKFGSSKAEVLAAITAKGGTLKPNSTDAVLRVTGISLGHRLAEELQVFLVNDKLFLGVFVFKAENEPQTIEYYNKLVQDISEIYGNGDPYKNFKSPFKEGDGEEITALEGGYATYFTTWKSDNKTVQTQIVSRHNSLTVTLRYADDVLVAEAQAQQKAKEKADF